MGISPTKPNETHPSSIARKQPTWKTPPFSNFGNRPTIWPFDPPRPVRVTSVHREAGTFGRGEFFVRYYTCTPGPRNLRLRDPSYVSSSRNLCKRLPQVLQWAPNRRPTPSSPCAKVWILRQANTEPQSSMLHRRNPRKVLGEAATFEGSFAKVTWDCLISILQTLPFMAFKLHR